MIILDGRCNPSSFKNREDRARNTTKRCLMFPGYINQPITKIKENRGRPINSIGLISMKLMPLPGVVTLGGTIFLFMVIMRFG